MNSQELIDRIASMRPPSDNVAAAPPVEVIAMVVRITRELRKRCPNRTFIGMA